MILCILYTYISKLVLLAIHLSMYVQQDTNNQSKTSLQAFTCMMSEHNRPRKSPPIPMAQQPTGKRDRAGTNLNKRWQTLVRMGRALHRQYGADSYFSISVPQRRKDYVFQSGPHVTPLLAADIVRA
ncbi:hypothetical protein F4821DRAFT_251473 [Hypoxylon rubiginosum]|uniref:Uncharacterized protein n=1 Tax=Hypoxylon rubiginosum TaxID=110542 RepID=A0ACC0CJ86_9PEZI|nr:hypothetical protein F4821DRAFT_251473 [Hypoxylon rubiginosum]